MFAQTRAQTVVTNDQAQRTRAFAQKNRGKGCQRLVDLGKKSMEIGTRDGIVWIHVHGEVQRNVLSQCVPEEIGRRTTHGNERPMEPGRAAP
ncbi:MAG: hypothetical protein ABSD76_11540 [Terriglobales bacterium]